MNNPTVVPVSEESASVSRQTLVIEDEYFKIVSMVKNLDGTITLKLEKLTK